MVKALFLESGSYEGAALSSSGKGSIERNNRGGEPHKNSEQETKETPEKMIRALQGIFCKGRYRSWTVG